MSLLIQLSIFTRLTFGIAINMENFRHIGIRKCAPDFKFYFFYNRRKADQYVLSQKQDGGHSYPHYPDLPYGIRDGQS